MARVADGEAQLPPSHLKKGGWITFPFIIGTMGGLSLAAGGWISNITVYLMEEFHVKSIASAQITIMLNGFTTVLPVLGAVIADSFLGCYSVIWISSLISIKGTILLILTTAVATLKPRSCDRVSGTCPSPTKLQYSILGAGLTLLSVGLGGTRFTMATMGADQFPEPKDQAKYITWYSFTLYGASLIACTAVVYVEDSISWAWGFGIILAATAFGLIVFLSGTKYYNRVQPQGSPFTALARVVVAAIRKRKLLLTSSTPDDYYYGPAGKYFNTGVPVAAPSKSFRFLNRAALKTEGDVKSDGSMAKSWKLCTVQEVEDLKALMKIFPVWSTGIFLNTPIGVQLSLSVLQALIMERQISPHFKIPAASIYVFIQIGNLTLSLFDKFLWPTWTKVIGRPPTPLQRIGVGHVFNIASMAVSAIVETKRRNIIKANHYQTDIAPMSILWLLPPLMAVGVGEAFHFPGQVELFYQEFPDSLKSIATAMISLQTGIAFYLSTAVIDFVSKITKWLPDDLNRGHLDNMYWLTAVIGTVNFGYYIICSWMYKYQRIGEKVDGNNGSTSPEENGDGLSVRASSGIEL